MGLALMVLSCEDKELVQPQKPTQQTVVVQKSNQEWALEDPDQKFLYADEEAFEQGLLSVLDGASENDIIVAQIEDPQAALYVYFDVAVVWFDPGFVEGKEICKEKTSLAAFAKCVYAYMKQGKKVTVWLDNTGAPHASIP